jgi:hypothetical protein
MSVDTRASRDLIHRAHDQEVLVSAPWRAADGGYESTTVTTDLSGYYRDHPATHRVDVMLLAEACRQAALSVTHRFAGLSQELVFFVNSMRVEISDVPALVKNDDEITITTVIGEMRLRGDGSPKKLSYSQLGRAGSGDVAMRSVLAVQGVPKEQYRDLRTYQRDGSPAPTTAALRGHAGHRDGLSTPTAVGRTQPTNVVLADLRVEPDGSSARMAPDLDNPSLFDHDYDHYPAMVLLEAGRQLALARTADASRWIAATMRAEFLRFAELDLTTLFTARSHGDRVDVVCLQNDAVVTRMSFDLDPMEGAA